MSDLLIVNPGGAHSIYGELSDEFTAIEPPLWARIIAGYVRDRGFNVSILDADALNLSPAAVADFVTRTEPRFVCICAYGHQPSASTQTMPAASAIASQVAKQRRGGSDCWTIVVGGHVSALPRRTLLEGRFDFGCVGEGPQTIIGLLTGVDLTAIPGLVYRDPHGVVRTNPSAELIDMAALHGQAWDLLPMDRYRAHNWQCLENPEKRSPYASIHTTLGCPFKCSFCCINAPFESNKYRMRRPEDVVAEILNLKARYGVATFKIVDEMFVLNERHYGRIAQMLADANGGEYLNIWAYARIDTVKPHTLALLRAAGVRWLALGIESGSAHVRDGADKSFSDSDIVDIVDQIRKAGINVIANYIFGLPDDDLESMDRTLDLSIRLNTEWANFYSAMAYPGSKLYEEAVREKAPLPDFWSGYSQHSLDCRPLDTKHVDGRTVLHFRDQAFIAYFDRPDYRDMILAKFGSAAVEHVSRMLSRKLRRFLLEEQAA